MRSSECWSASQTSRNGRGKSPARISINAALKKCFCMAPSLQWAVAYIPLLIAIWANRYTENVNRSPLIHLMQFRSSFLKCRQEDERQRTDNVNGREKISKRFRVCLKMKGGVSAAAKLSGSNLAHTLLCNFGSSLIIHHLSNVSLPGFINASLLLFYWSGFNVIDQRGGT